MQTATLASVTTRPGSIAFAPLIPVFSAAELEAEHAECRASLEEEFRQEEREMAEWRAAMEPEYKHLEAVQAIRPLVEADYVLTARATRKGEKLLWDIQGCAVQVIADVYVMKDGSGLQLVDGEWQVIPVVAIAA